MHGMTIAEWEEPHSITFTHAEPICDSTFNADNFSDGYNGCKGPYYTTKGLRFPKPKFLGIDWRCGSGGTGVRCHYPPMKTVFFRGLRVSSLDESRNISTEAALYLVKNG
jgi:hypothetical protein